MKKRIIPLLSLFLFCGCAAIEVVPGFVHTAALMIGDNKANTLSQVEHILALPKEIGYAFKGTSNEIEVRRYAFTQVYDLVLYFHNDIFFQAGLVPPGSKDYPYCRGDYKTVRKGSLGPIGYMLTSNGKTGSIDALWGKDAEKKLKDVEIETYPLPELQIVLPAAKVKE